MNFGNLQTSTNRQNPPVHVIACGLTWGNASLMLERVATWQPEGITTQIVAKITTRNLTKYN